MTQDSMTIPLELSSALAADKEAQTIFNNLPPSHQREYIKWVEEAKKAETRVRRVQKMLEMLKQGRDDV
ncbi:MAG: YdeI/OmpD-associated family protein [Chloroflexi bacterium]|nr:YdeI/OmpD-associated family protein [Chloroflexota bacterium]